MIPEAQPLIQVPELYLIGALVFFFALWGWRHGLDAVILAGLFVLLARVSVGPVLLPIVSAFVNIFFGVFVLFSTGKFSTDNLFAVIKGNPDVVKPLINLQDPKDGGAVLLGTALFILIAFLGFRFAEQKAGGKDTFLEQVFGLIGGAALGYLCITFVVARHFAFPQQIVIQPSVTPQISVDAPLIVAIVIVLIVFGIQRSKAPAKKK